MFGKIRASYYKFGAAMTVGMLMPGEAQAQTVPNTFNTIANNIVTGVQDMPGLISSIAYLFGVLLGALGIMKLKDHVENPGQVPLKDGAIRLVAGGALFALPIVIEAMKATLDQRSVADATAAVPNAATLQRVVFSTQ